MKLSCTQEKLNKALNIVNRIVSPRGTLPVLNNILVKTDNGQLRFSATDLEIGINTWIGAKIDEEGAITIPSRLMSDFVNTNNDETIKLEQKDTTLSLKSAKYEANIKGIEAGEFPLIPDVKKDPQIELNSKDLKVAIDQVAFSAATDETRPVLTGVLLKAKDNELKLVATDSYRLAEKTIKLEKKVSEEINIIIPQRTMHELSRIISSYESKVEIRIGENQIQFNFDEIQLVSRLLEGSFPDYDQIIPKKSETKTTLAITDFANSIKMASYFARESANNIKLRINNDKNMEVVAVSPQVGDNVSRVNSKTVGKDIEIAFNAKFILDALNVIKSKDVILETTDKTRAGVIRPIKDEGYLYLIMPLRVEE
jgi:DNA polymerase-3 subunit beta